MMRSLTVLALLGCSMLSACGTSNRNLESVHQPVVSRTDYVFDMPAPGTGIGDADPRPLAAWFESLGLKYGDRVSVDTQGFGPGARDNVSAVAARYGLLIEETAPVTQGEIPPGSIRVVVSRMTASVPSCPDWSRPSNANFGGDSMSNYGCATNTNLAAMIADPRDLISGRAAPSSVDADQSRKAVATYRSATQTGAGGLKTESTKGN
jgi:pilus assembly protein CpaD